MGWPSYCQLRICLFLLQVTAVKVVTSGVWMHFLSRNSCLYCLKRLSEKYVRSFTVSVSAISGPTRFHIQIASSSVVLPSICYLLSEHSVKARATVHTLRLSRSHRILCCLPHRLYGTLTLGMLIFVQQLPASITVFTTAHRWLLF